MLNPSYQRKLVSAASRSQRRDPSLRWGDGDRASPFHPILEEALMRGAEVGEGDIEKVTKN
jgi:hypothetical protein